MVSRESPQNVGKIHLVSERVPQKGERVPRESPASPPASPPALSQSPNQGRHAGLRSGSTCGVITAASTCAFFGLHIPQLHSLGQPVPASLMHKHTEPVRHAPTQATHVVVPVDPAHGLLQTLFQLARCLLPRPDRPCLLLQSSQPGHRGLVQQEICNVGWLSTRALLRIGPV